MPFYFALPRSGFSSVQGRQETGRTDYVRTAPTSLTFTTSVALSRVLYTKSHNLHAIAMSAFAGQKAGIFDKAFRTDCPSRMLYPAVNVNDVIRLGLPKMSFRFKELSDSQESRLVELNMEERNIKGKGRVWVGQLDTRNAAEVVSFGTVQDYASMGGTVSVRGVSAMNSIVKILTLAAQTQTMSCEKDTGKGVGVIEYASTTKLSLHEYTVSAMSHLNKDNSREVACILNAPVTSILARTSLGRIWGNVSEIPELLSNGIFCPFEPNYSQTDRRAINVLLSDFSCLCTEPENFDTFDKELVEMWTREICLTMEGEFIAHMIACLCLAKRIGASVYFLVTGSLYEGTLLYGTEELSFKLVGGATYRSIEKPALIEDISRYAFHTTTLREILSEVGFTEMEIDTGVVRSMRQLRNIVLGKLGQAVTPQLEASIGRKLLFLNFREKQESVNPTTISKFVSYIHPTVPTAIPDTVYLDRRAFFTKDNTVVALSMFGLYAPSPIISGQTLLLAVPSNSTKVVSKEPNSIQFSKKELLVAAKDWDGFARGGTIVQPSNKIKRGVRFAGAEKTEIWGVLVGYAGAGVSARRSENQASKRDRDTEKREREEDSTDKGKREAPGGVSVDFSMFATMPVDN